MSQMTFDRPAARVVRRADGRNARHPEHALLAARALSERRVSALEPPALLHLQRTAGNGGIVGLLSAAVVGGTPVQRAAGPIVVQRDWTGDRTTEVRDVMNGDDWNRTGGPWYLLNGHNPEALVGIFGRLGSSGRQQLLAHPVDGTRYDKPRLELALSRAGSARSALAQLNGMDAIRFAIFSTLAGPLAAAAWVHCWNVLLKMSHGERMTLYRSMGAAQLHLLLENVERAPEPLQARLEGEINDVIAPPVKDILLDFVPDASELPDSNGDPKPLGQITVLLKGKDVMRVPARGGPWKSYKDTENPGHTADPTAPGTFVLAAGAPIVTSSWVFSQLANGTPIRDTSTDVEFLRKGAWISVGKLRKPMTRDQIMQPAARIDLQRKIWRGDLPFADAKKRWDDMIAKDDYTPLPPVWQLNDFGKEGFRIVGTPGDIIHTTP
jgi:hypothetical protein